jgi:hypothetical protein
MLFKDGVSRSDYIASDYGKSSEYLIGKDEEGYIRGPV